MAEVEKRSDRDDKGKFIKGHKVPSPRAGRPRKADSMPFLQAIASAAYSPEQIVDLIHETVDLARRVENPKIMLEVVRLVLDYAIGKPVQRTLTATIDPERLKEIFGGLDEQGEADTGPSIEGQGGVVE